MNDTFQQFREVQQAQKWALEKNRILSGIGKSLEEAIEFRLDEMQLNHPEILDSILALHLVVMYETHPELEPKLSDEGNL